MSLTTCLFIIEINFVTEISYSRLYINNVLVNTKITDTKKQLYRLYLQNWMKVSKGKAGI